MDQFEKESYSASEKVDLAIKITGRFLETLRASRGKPGRHPKPFNVLVYHLINKCTYRRFDENQYYIYHKDGQHKLKKDWKLILFLILDIHCREIKLPEIEKFISRNKNKPAREALKILKEKLLNIYKNFPRLDGWAFEREIAETGYRKLTVNDDGTLKSIWL